MKKHVEVEGGELAIRNKKGDVVIIPKGNKKWVEQKLKEKCYECIDKFVSKLPTAASKAQDGSTYPPGNEPTYIGSDLPEVTVTAKAPGWYKNVRQYAKDNPFNIDAYVQERMQNPRGRDKIKAIDPKRYEKELRQEGLKKRQEELQQQAASYIGSKKPKGMSRAEWLNTLSSREEQLVKTDPKYQTSLWQDTKRGLQSLGEMTPVQAAANISKDKGYSAREKQELIQGYMQQPGLSAISDVTKTLSPLAVPSKLVQSTYRKEYGPMEALAGKKNKASLFEDIATDPLTYTGAGLLGKGSKVSKISKVENAEDVVTQLRRELSEKGIVSSQKTLNLPGKEIIRQGVSPWQYNIPDKLSDIKSLVVKTRNPDYINIEGDEALDDYLQRQYKRYLFTRKSDSELKSFDDFKNNYLETEKINYPEKFFKTKGEVLRHKFKNRYGDDKSNISKNRYATWDMYLGKPQTKHPIYDISELTKSKDNVVYTIKEDFMNKGAIEASFEKLLTRTDVEKAPAGYNFKKSDSDSYFGTMGGFHWDVTKLPDGNFKIFANDVWDLQPFQKNNKLSKSIRNIEVGKALGIGKPLNVKVGFIVDGETKKIINTFGLAPAGVAAAAALQSKQNTKKPQ